MRSIVLSLVFGALYLQVPLMLSKKVIGDAVSFPLCDPRCNNCNNHGKGPCTYYCSKSNYCGRELEYRPEKGGADCRGCGKQGPIYIKQQMKSACCTGPDTFHERCYCSATLSFCKKSCDQDNNCKGYVKEGPKTCQIATSSPCRKPTCEKHSPGKRNELKADHQCGSGGVEGCFIKEKGSVTEGTIKEVMPANTKDNISAPALLPIAGVVGNINENEQGDTPESDGLSIPIAGAIGGIGIILLLIVIIAVVVAKRRKRIKRQNTFKSEDEFSNYGDYEYDYADATNLRNARVNNEELHLETITNPYYGGNDYIEINGSTAEPTGLGSNVNTLKVVNNVYYE